jgi:hypothetical protein
MVYLMFGTRIKFKSIKPKGGHHHEAKDDYLVACGCNSIAQIGRCGKREGL